MTSLDQRTLPCWKRAVLWLGAVLVHAGCSPATPTCPPESTPPEASFNEQAERVREGRSNLIRLDRTPVADADLAALGGLEDRLQRLNLSNTELTDEGLAQLAKFKSLVQLRVRSRRITDQGLAALVQLPVLKHLHLIDAPITDAGLQHLHGLKSLSSLYLDQTQGTAEGFAQLEKALPKAHLHVDGGHPPGNHAHK